MSYIHLSSDLILGKAELQRLIDFLSDGYKKILVDNSYSFGIIKSASDSQFANFKVESGTNVGTIKINTSSFALDNNGDLIYKIIEDNIAIPNDNQFYWVKIKYQNSTLEEGTVSIDNQGNLTGVDTKFTEVLRGQPNHPSRIKLTDASLNTQEYIVQEVLSDTSAILLGVFQSELNLHYAVVGSFTPGTYPSEVEKYPFQYDSTIPITVVGGGLVLEAVLNTAPSKTDGEEFYIARVRRNGSTLTIEDKRTEFWATKADFDLSNIDRSQSNALIGVEYIKYDNRVSTLDHNQIKIGWGMRSSNWVVNSELRRVTFVSAEESGKFKVVSDFVNGSFDGWRLYSANGSYKKVISSILSGGQINMVLDSLDPDDYINGDTLVVVPDIEEIEIKFSPDASGDPIGQVETNFRFPVSQGYGLMKILVPAYLDVDESEPDLENATYSYNILYRYKTFNNFTAWLPLPNDVTNGYYDETSFDNNGILRTDPLDRNRKTYIGHATNGYIEFIVNSRSYYQTLIQVARGDKFGVQRVNLSEISNHPVFSVEVGQRDQFVIFEGADVLGVDWFISLLPGELQQNEFYLVFENTITLDVFHLRIVENYESTSIYDELLDFNDELVLRAAAKNLIIKCTWDGSTWHLFKFSSFIDLFGTDPGEVPEIGTALGNSQAVETNSSGKLVTITTFSSTRIPSLDASKITTGTFGTARIPSLDASKITSGTFNVSRIPSLDASKITSGVLNQARLPDAGLSKGAIRIATINEVLNGHVSNAAVTPNTLSSKVGHLNKEVIEIGDWNMDTTSINFVKNPVTFSYIRNVSVIIRNDSNDEYLDLLSSNAVGLGGGSIKVDSSNFELSRSAGGLFDNTFYDSTSYNRGWIIVEYIDYG